MKFFQSIFCCIGLVLMLHLDLLAQDRDYFLQSHINSQNGLPQNTVRDIAYSSSGFLWIATEDGIARYDGKNTYIYNSQNSPLPSNRICQLIQTLDNHLYCLTDEDDLLEIIEHPPFIQVVIKGKLPDKGFLKYHLFQSRSIDEFNNVYHRIKSDLLSYSNQLVVIALQKKPLYIEKNKNGIRLLSTQSDTASFISIDDCSPKRFFTLHDSLLFMSPELQFYKLNYKNGQILNFKKEYRPSKQTFTNQTSINNGRIIWNEKTATAFLIESNCLYEIKQEGTIIILQKVIEQLPTFSISEVSYSPDKEQLIIGTLSNGFYLYRKSWFSTLRSPYSSNIFYAQAGTRHNSIITTKPNQELSLDKQELLNDESKNIYTLYLDTLRQQLWTISADTLQRFDLIRKKTIGHYILPHNNEKSIHLIGRRNDSSLYIGTPTTLYYLKIDSGFKKLADYQFQRSKKQLYCFLQDGDSVLWIGTHHGLFKYMPSTRQLTKENFPNHIVRALFKTSSGMLLIGTYGNGIYVKKERSYIPIPLDRFNNLKTTHSFMEDRLGFIWMSSNNGLYRVNSSEINAFVHDKLSSPIYYYSFSTNDGLPTNEFNGGCYPSSISLPNGTWSFPSMNGLVLFHPEDIKLSSSCSNLFIDRILVNDKSSQAIKNAIEIPTHQFKLAIYLSSPNWSDETNLQISYKTDENEWVVLRQNNTPIVLQNLSGGRHILTIRKRSGFSPSDIKEIKFQIVVPKLLYEFWWFWPLVFIGVLLLIAVAIRISNHAIRRRKERLEALVHVKTKELKEAVITLEQQNQTIKESEDNLRIETELKTTLLFLLSHDIATPLRYVNMYLSDCTSPTAPPIDVNDLVDLKISTTNLEYLLDNIVTWVKHSIENNTRPPIVSVNLHKIIVEKIRLFDLMIQRKQNRLQNLVSTEIIIPADSFIVSMAIQNILGNAIHHTKNGDIQIIYQQSDLAHQIIITDTGIGLNTAKIELQTSNNMNEVSTPLSGYGIGLKIANQLLELINGNIEVKPNDKGKGTMAIIYIRKSNT